MLHRRPTGSGNSSTLPPRSTPSTSIPTKNTAYTPLRRPSANLYPGTSNGSTYGGAPGAGSGAKYTLPSLSPGYSGINLTPQPSTGTGGGSAYAPAQGYFQNGNAGGGGLGVFDLGDEPSKAKSWSEWSVEDIMANTRAGLEKFRRGLEDALRLDRSFSLVWSDRELRTLIIRSTVINLLSLLLLSFTPFIFSAASLSNDALARTKSVGLWYNLLLSWPVFVVCFWINATWAPDISRRAHTLLHPAYRNQPPSTAPSSSFSKDDLIAKVFNSIQRILLISDFTLVSRLIMLIPLLGRPLAFGYMCIIDSYYCFDSTFTAKGWTLNRRILFMQERTGYMIGFGLAATFITSFGPPLVNMAVFALIYPFFVIQAQLARPPVPRHSLLPSTPSPQSSLPPSPSGVQSSNNPFLAPPTTSVEDIRAGNFQIRVPIFFFATFALMGLRWLEAAIGRNRGERRGGMGFKERPGKRLG